MEKISQPSFQILGMRVDTTTYEEATEQVVAWARAGESRYVCVANVHMVMEAYDDPSFRELVNRADLVTPDGMPLVWLMRQLGNPKQERVYGPELTLRVCERASKENLPVGFYGGHPDALPALIQNLKSRFPGLHVVYAYSPPFRPLTEEEDAQVVEEINQSGARILFVGLGCPKQERFMAEHKNRISAVMIGVGAAFDIYAGRTRQAPKWMQQAGLEWLFRLLQEPRRLWQRYAKHNPRFLLLALVELAKIRGRTWRSR